MELKRYKRYCKDIENVENYQRALADNFKGWHCHHRLETHNSDGELRLVNISAAELLALGMYYNRPAEELIFLPESEHHSLHSKGEHNAMYGKQCYWKGKKRSEETRKKISEAKKGNKNTLGYHHSAEAKNKIAEANRINSTGRHWYNNGKENKFCFDCPPGFVPGRLRETVNNLPNSL